jgi:AcrR family transcriptional regulator
LWREPAGIAGAGQAAGVPTSPFLEPDNPNLAAMLGDAAVHLLAAHGVDGLSSRAMARYLGVTGPALTQQASRSEQIRLMVIAFTRRWLLWSCARHDEEMPARLPSTEEERHGVRVLAALTELARADHLRGNPVPAALLSEARREERDDPRWELSELLGREPAPGEVAETAALVTGVRLELAAFEPSLEVEHAAGLIRTHVARMGAAPG